MDPKDVQNSSLNSEYEERNFKKRKSEGDPNESMEILPFDAVSKAFRNPLILTKILNNVQNLDVLKSCRLTNYDWNEISTQILLKRGNLSISLKYNTELYQYFSSHNEKLSLKQLTKIILDSKGFPCANFIIHGHLNSEDVQEFLVVFGSEIQTLKFQNCSDNDLNILRKILTSQVPCLNFLHLSSFYQVLEDDDFYMDAKGEEITIRYKLNLPRLKTVELTDVSSPIVDDISNSTTSLEYCKGEWRISELVPIFPRGSQLKEIHLKPWLSELQALEILQDQDLKLIHFGIDYTYTSASYYEHDDEVSEEEFPTYVNKLDTLVSKILEISKSSLKIVDVTQPEDDDCKFEWPVLKNVWKLNLSKESYCSISFAFSDYFPNLHTVTLTDKDQGCCDSELELIPCSFQDIAPNVKTLQLSGRYTEIEYLEVFPNIQHLSLTDIKNFPRVGLHLWNAKSLKSLELQFAETEDNRSPAVDETFTGFERKACKFLQTAGRKLTRGHIASTLRMYACIFELEELRELRFLNGYQETCADYEDYQDNEEWKIGISQVSIKYAFDYMDDLQIIH